MSAPNDPTLDAVLDEVRQERARQEAKWGEQNHPMLVIEPGAFALLHELPHADDARALCQQRHNDGVGSYFDILLEEISEAHDAAWRDGERGDGNEVATREELVQVAAVAVAMIQAIDRRAAKAGAR